MTQIKVTSLGESKYHVEVQEDGSTTKHEVTVTESDLKKYGNGVSAERLLKASFEFLLEREPKESILRTFPLPLIARYFPEYPTDIRARLG